MEERTRGKDRGSGLGRAVRAIALAAGLLGVPAGSAASQAVWLDFDTETDPGEHVYTAAERVAIRDAMRAHFALFGFSVSLVPPSSGPYAVILFNGDDVPLGAFGVAPFIDFRNLIPDDAARVNIGGLLAGPLDTPENVVVFSGWVGSHELGHLVGLRHGNAMGALGDGISPVPGNAGYVPPYPGPPTAFETNDHVMSSPETGATPEDFVSDKHFGERSAVKLAFAQWGQVVEESADPHDTPETAMPIALDTLPVPNTLRSGRHAGHWLGVEALVVRGAIDSPGEVDYYALEAEEGDLLNFEVLSETLRHRLDTIDTALRIEDSTGQPIAYHASSGAENEDDFDSVDPILIDLEVPADDVYRLAVWHSGASPDPTGEYELFGYRFVSLPEPGRDALLLLGMALAAVSARRARS